MIIKSSTICVTYYLDHNMQAIKLIWINRKWNDEAYPISELKIGKELLSSHQAKNQIKEILNTYFPNGKVNKQMLDQVENDMPKYILKTHLNILDLETNEEKKAASLKFVETVQSTLSFNEGFTCLFLFHRGEGFTDEMNLLRGNDSYSWYETFGGGNEPIYIEYGGILDIDYTYDETFVRYFDEQTHKSTLIESKFDQLWNYYFHRTHEKLLRMRGKILWAQLPYYPETAKNEVKRIVRSFLNRWNQIGSSSLGQEEPNPTYSFQFCDDLKKFERVISPELIQALEDFAAGRLERDATPTSYEQLNEYLDKMVVALKSLKLDESTT